MHVLKFSAAATATNLFQMSGNGWVWFDAWSTNWNSATLKLTVDPDGAGTYHDVGPILDTTTPLIGGDFTLTHASDMSWSNPVFLGPGIYGFTVTGTPTVPVRVHVSHKLLRPGTSAETYRD